MKDLLIIFEKIMISRAISRNSLIKRSFSTSFSRCARIGFIGLGNMGAHMANNLIKKGHDVVGFDVVPGAFKKVSKKIEKASSPKAVADANVETIITMLPNSSHVMTCFTGENGILESKKLSDKTPFLDSSTIDPSTSKELAKLSTSSCGAFFMDSPVSGGVNAARDGSLTFMVGGSKSHFPRANAILSMMGKNIVHCGDVGTGEAAKICNNMLLAISMIGTAETMALGQKLGLDAKLLAQILNTSSGRCWSSEVYNPVPGVLEGVPASNKYAGGFGTALMKKDLDLAGKAASDVQANITLGANAQMIYRLMTNAGLGRLDFSAVYKFIK